MEKIITVTVERDSHGFFWSRAKDSFGNKFGDPTRAQSHVVSVGLWMLSNCTGSPVAVRVNVIF